MAEQIKKVSLNATEITTTDPVVYVRFRIVSDDLNDVSEWSPIYEIDKTVTP